MFNEGNIVEQMILETCQGLGWQFVPGPQLLRQAACMSCEPTALAAGGSGTTLHNCSGIQPTPPGAKATCDEERPDASEFGSQERGR